MLVAIYLVPFLYITYGWQNYCNLPGAFYYGRVGNFVYGTGNVLYCYDFGYCLSWQQYSWNKYMIIRLTTVLPFGAFSYFGFWQLCITFRLPELQQEIICYMTKVIRHLVIYWQKVF